MVNRSSILGAFVSCVVCAGLWFRLHSAKGDDIATTVGDEFSHPNFCDPNVAQTAGHIQVAEDTEYFFWLFESRSSPTTDPLILWLPGGPACSSQLSLFVENGPCTVDADGGGTTPNTLSWNAKANMLWVDQPAGVGFSSGLGTFTERGVAENMLVFLQEFFTKLPQYGGSDFYIFGESHAGHYAPAIAHRILASNEAEEGFHVPLKGIAIGNGLTHPEEQYKWYAEMGHTGGIAEGGHAPGVLNDATHALMTVQTPLCTMAIHVCNADIALINNSACILAFQECNIMSQAQYMSSGRNLYDMRLECNHGGTLCYDFDAVRSFLNLADVQDELGVKPGTKWEICSKAAASLFIASGDWMVNYQGLVADLLHQDIQVLVYAGDCDYVGNWLGNKAWTTKLEWQGADAFKNAQDLEWQMHGETVAKLRSAQGLHFMQVYNAGMMVPMDQPEVALEIANLFISQRLDKNSLQMTIPTGNKSLIVV